MTFQDLMGTNYKGNDAPLQNLYRKNQNYFEELVDHLKQNTVIPLFGAGFSAAAYPGWANLLRKMAESYPDCHEALEQHLKNGEFEEAASLLCAEMGEFEFQEELFRTFGPQTLPEAIQKISKERKAIPQIFTGPLATTNVEQVLEDLYHRQLPVLCPHTSYQQPQAERALQSSSPILLKLHGDIDDLKHVIFTKEAYDAVYKNLEEDSTLVRTLKQIFSAKVVLFLGCSLESDRVLKVLEHCCDHHVYYALVGLPEETVEKSAPLSPKLLVDGKEQEAYRRRRQFMAKHHIKCIWYPHGQHNALDVFLQELQNRLGPPPKPPSVIPPARRDILGRELSINSIYQSCLNGRSPIFVTGPGGIGKTEVCHMVLRRMEEAGKTILYVNVTNIQEPATLCHAIARAAGAEPLSDAQATNLPFYLSYLNGTIAAYPQAAVYLDNWEDLWYATDGQEEPRLQLLEWMAELCRRDVPVLLSSRIYPEEYDVSLTPYPLPALDRASGVDRALFQQVYQSKNGHLALEGDAYETLLKQLDGHPLSIVLTATQAAGAVSWDSVMTRWTTATQKTSNTRHACLNTALQMSWDAVSDSPGCILVWGLVALSRGDLAFSQLMELAGSPAEQQQWEECVHQLRTASLLDWSEDGTALQMLQPIKEAFFLLATQEEALPCFERWSQFFLPILEQANTPKDPHRQAAHVEVVKQLPQILSLLERMSTDPWPDSFIEPIKILSQNVFNYFQFSTIQSLSVCEKLESIFQHKGLSLFWAESMERQGNLFQRLGYPGKADELYQQAEILYQQERDNLGLANVLLDKGDLFRRLGKSEQADELYQQAETLFQQEQDNLGLANTLRSRGDLFRRFVQLDKADEFYQQAENLFQQEQNNLGLANTLRSRGDLFRLLGKLDKVDEFYQQAENLFRQERDNLGLANTLLSRGNLFQNLGKFNQANDLYQQAEILFRQVQNNLGLANTLRNQGILRLSNQDKAGAVERFQTALSHYESEQTPFGIASTCALLSIMLVDSEEHSDEAAALAQRAKEIAETLPSGMKKDVLSILKS